MVPVKVTFHPGPSEDYAAAYSWYYERGRALAENFETEIDRGVRLISRNPLRWPIFHLIRFHAVLAPNANLRRQIVPAPPERATETSSENAQVQGAPARGVTLTPMVSDRHNVGFFIKLKSN